MKRLFPFILALATLTLGLTYKARTAPAPSMIAFKTITAFMHRAHFAAGWGFGEPQLHSWGFFVVKSGPILA